MAINVGTLEALIRLRDELSPKMPAVVKAVDQATAAVAKGAPAIDEWTRAQQRAAMRMEDVHSAALKMNEGFASSDDKAQRLSQTLNAVSTTATAAGSALGMPTGQLLALNAAADVAGLGFGKLSSTMVGFNAASVGVAGAGLAIGVAIGTLLREIPAVTKAVDGWAESLFRLAGAQIGAAGPPGFQEAMAASEAAAAAKRTAVMLSMGMSYEDIRKHIEGVTSSEKNWLDAIKKGEAAEKKAAESARKYAEEVKKQAEAFAKLAPFMGAFQQGLEDAATVQTLLAGVAAHAMDDLVASIQPAVEITSKEAFAISELNNVVNPALGLWTRYADVVEQETENASANVAVTEEQATGLEKASRAIYGALAITSALSDALTDLGVSSETGIGQAVKGFEELSQAAADGAESYAKFQSGDIVGGIQSGISAVKNLVAGAKDVWKGLFGDAEGEKVNDMRDAFVAEAGGIDQLNARAVAAGLSLDRLLDVGKVKDYDDAVKMLNTSLEFIEGQGGLELLKEKAETAGVSLNALFDAKSAKELDGAIADINRGLDTWNEAQQKVQEAMDKYGITVDQMGPKWSQQHLDTQAMGLVEDFRLLQAAGADVALITEKMAPAMNEYVATAVKAGATVPEAMRPQIDAMIANHQLLDANGNAYNSAAEAGITYAMSTSEAMTILVDKITLLVNSLLGIPSDVSTNVNINENHTSSTSGPPSSGEPGEVHSAKGFHGMVSRPTRFLVGEAGPEHVSVTPRAAMRASAEVSSGQGRSGPEILVLPVHLQGQKVQTIVLDVVKKAVRNNEGELATVLRRAGARG